jgi:hypothetical protein
MSTLADLFTAAPSTEILTEGYTLDADEKGYYGNIRFWFSGADLQAFTYTVTGKSTTVTINGITFTRLIPLQHPYISGNCYADSVHVYPPPGAVAGLDGSATGIAFADYFADVHFSTPEFNYEGAGGGEDGGEDYPCVSLRLRGGEDRVTRPGSSYIFPSDNLRLNHDVGVPVKTLDFALTMHRLPNLDVPLYAALEGCINESDFYGFPAGTVLYDGPESEGQFLVAGNPSFEVTHLFKYRQIPHDEIMRPDGKGFEAPIEAARPSGDPGGSTPDTTNEEDTADPIYLLAEADLNMLWGE